MHQLVIKRHIQGTSASLSLACSHLVNVHKNIIPRRCNTLFKNSKLRIPRATMDSIL